MFDQTFITPDSPRRRAVPLTASLALQSLAVTAAIGISLVSTRTLPVVELKSRLLAPPPPVAVQVVKPLPQSAAAVVQRPRFRLDFRIRPLNTAPHPAASQSVSIAAPDLPTSGPGNDAIGSAFPGNRRTRSSTDTASSARTDAPKTGPARISAGVAEANLIEKVMPKYPPVAVIAHIQGSVRFRAVIGTDGRIQDLELIEGPPILVGAAQQAVLAWRYRPTLLNGKPVPVVTDITVNFLLGEQGR